MDLVALIFYVICEGENGTNGCHLAIFSEDVAFVHYFVATHPHSHSHPIYIVVLMVLASRGKANIPACIVLRNNRMLKE